KSAILALSVVWILRTSPSHLRHISGTSQAHPAGSHSHQQDQLTFLFIPRTEANHCHAAQGAAPPTQAHLPIQKHPPPHPTTIHHPQHVPAPLARLVFRTGHLPP